MAALSQIHTKKLGEGIEYAYKHFDDMKDCEKLSPDLKDWIEAFQQGIREIKK